eukprot:CFRG5048T1
MAKKKATGVEDIYKLPRWKRGGRSKYAQAGCTPYPIANANAVPAKSPFTLTTLPSYMTSNTSKSNTETEGKATSESVGLCASEVPPLEKDEGDEVKVLEKMPVIANKPRLSALFTGKSVHVVEVEDATVLYKHGCFGKGDQSRGHASWMPEIEFKRSSHGAFRGGYKGRGRGKGKDKFQGQDNTISNESTRLNQPQQFQTSLPQELPLHDATPTNISALAPTQSPACEGFSKHVKSASICSTLKSNIQKTLPPSTIIYTYNCDAGTCDENVKEPAVTDIVADDVKEREVLGLEETFYLVNTLQCLDVYKEDSPEPMSLNELWKSFCDISLSFIPRYCVYHHYRANGWIPRSGLKYATDFVLYYAGPIFTHSIYSVMIKTENAPSEFNHLNALSRPDGFETIQNLQRLTEGVAKDTVLAFVIFPDNADISTPVCLASIEVDEFILRRWRPEGAV